MTDRAKGPSTDHDYEVRTRAIETLLYDRGIVTPGAVDSVVTEYVNDLGPMRGAKVVARAWSDPEFRARLLRDCTAAASEMGCLGEQSEQLVALECSSTAHHVVVCTLCSCYPWPLLGLPPAWYKSMAYRANMVADPRRTLQRDFGLEIPHEVALKVWDSSAEIRYIVIPQRPQGTEEFTEDQLVKLVTRDSMIGVGRAISPIEMK
jgi:nitrile hydratase